MRFLTKRGYEFGEVSSAMQKAIRRGDTRLAGYWALELWASGYGNYVWKRLLTVSAEDCWGMFPLFRVMSYWLMASAPWPASCASWSP
jgi:replication-associated recombination protein RarA